MTIGFAHRGARARAPENTLEAFRLALELGATGLESDVWLTADHVPVLQHDGVVERDGTQMPIGNLARAALPPSIPTLRELYEACGTAVPLSLDLKDEAAAAPTIAVAREAGALEQLWLCHWNWKVVAALRDDAGPAKLVDSTHTSHMRTPPRERAVRMQQLGIDAINLHYTQWTCEWVEIYHAHGRRVLGWDAQELEALHGLVELGVDGVFSDHVDRMMSVLDAGA